MPKNTDELLKILKNTSDISSFLKQEAKELTEQMPLSTCLNGLLMEKEVKKSDIIRRSGLDRGYAYDIFAGTKFPVRDKALALCFAFPLTDTETQKLLKTTGYPPLYARITRDSVILYALSHHWALSKTNEFLYEWNYPIIA